MINNIYKIVIGVLISLLILGFIFYKRSESNSEKQRVELVRRLEKNNLDRISQLKIETALNEKRLDSSKKIHQINIVKMNSLKLKLKSYEKVRYFDDIDSDKADSIITNSHYRHRK